MDSSLLAAQLLVTGALAGLCWTVQLAVYGLFARLLAAIGAEAFRAHHAAYVRAMGWIAAPLMIAELGLAAGWAWQAPSLVSAWIGVGLIAAIWLLTFGFIVPVHARLQAAPTESAARLVTRLNWVRTALWTARAVLLASAATGP